MQCFGCSQRSALRLVKMSASTYVYKPVKKDESALKNGPTPDMACDNRPVRPDQADLLGVQCGVVQRVFQRLVGQRVPLPCRKSMRSMPGTPMGGRPTLPLLG